MSRFLAIAVLSFIASLSVSFAQAGEFVEEGLRPAELLALETANYNRHDRDRHNDRHERDRYERDCRRRGDCRRGPPPRPAPPMYVCYAESASRRIYVGQDYDVRSAQRQALGTCQRYARRCRPLGCERR